MKLNKLFASLGLLLALGLVGCNKKPEPDTPDTPDTPETPTDEVADTFADTLKDKYKGKKILLTCAGFEGLSYAQSWLESYGLTAKESEEYVETTENEFWVSKLANLDDEHINGDYVVVIGVAWTGKGISGVTTIEQEIARAKKLAGLVTRTENKVAGLVLVEVAGSPNRGANADKLLNEVAPYATEIIAKTNTNTDGYFTNTAKTSGAALVVSSTTSKLKSAFGFLIGK